MACQVDPKRLLWRFINSAGGVSNRRVLKDAIFLAKEYGFYPFPFSFKRSSGLGTSRKSDEIDANVDELIEEGFVFDTGGPATLKILKSPKAEVDPELEVAARLTKRIHPDDLSMLAAFRMAFLREKDIQGDSVSDEDLRIAAAWRLGWPLEMFNRIEDGLMACKGA